MARRCTLTLACALLGLLTFASGFKDVDDYFDQWANLMGEGYAHRMFPHGSKFFDAEIPVGTYVELAGVTFQIPYFGRTYNELYISAKGYISFVNPEVPYYKRQVTWPHPEYPYKQDPPMVMPYYSATYRSGENGDEAAVYWRLVDPSLYESETVERDIAEAELDKFTAETRWRVFGASSFYPKYAIVVTWYKVRFEQCFDDCATNTFQTVILTDNFSHTYVIYNYYDINWEGGAPIDNCHPKTGTTTPEFPECFPAHAGFNAGDGRGFIALPFSHTPEVTDLDDIGGPRVLGRFVFEVSDGIIWRGGCINEEFAKDQTTWPLQVYPQVTSMLGGEEIHFSGPCLEDKDAIKCRFGDPDTAEEVRGQVVDSLRGACVVPPLGMTGDTTMHVSIKGGAYIFNASIFIEHPEKKHPILSVKLDNVKKWNSLHPEELTITWDPRAFIRPVYNVSVHTRKPYEQHVDITLFGYREMPLDEVNRVAREQWQWVVLTILADSLSNTGIYTFDPKDHQCELDDCDWHLAAIKVSISEGIEPEHSRGIWSDLFASGWHIDKAMTKKYESEDWPWEKCMEWKATPYEQNLEWVDTIPPCPCTLEQAIVDIGNFMWPTNCNVTSELIPEPCLMNEGAFFCFTSVAVNAFGAGSHCCYDDAGSLMYSGDTLHGSFSQRSHRAGVYPYNEMHKIPGLSHWMDDRLPEMWCCEWPDNKNGCIEHFMPKRPTGDCAYHTAPGIAVAYGDPHYITFDGTTYTFNGRGEYWLLRVNKIDKYDNVNIQIRMDKPLSSFPLPIPGDDVKATVITSVVIQEGDEPGPDQPRVEVKLNPFGALMPLTILINGKEEFFGGSIESREFRGIDDRRVVIIRNPLAPDEVYPSNFTIVFESGLGVQVAQKMGLLVIYASAPRKFFEVTEGLFGFWNDKSEDDLKDQNGEIVFPEDPEQVHIKFGQAWEVTADESRFTYFGQEDWAKLRDPDFEPNYTPEFPDDMANVTISEEDVQEACGENPACRFDYKATLNREIALATSGIQAWAMNNKQMGAHIASCRRIDVPKGDKEFTNYMQGGKVEFTGCEEGHTLTGSTKYECMPPLEGETRGRWNPPFTAKCRDNDELNKERTMLAMGIAIPIILICIIVCVVMVFVMLRKKKRKEQEQAYRRDDRESSTVTQRTAPKREHTVTSMPSTKMQRDRAFDDNSQTSRSASQVGSQASLGSVILTEELQPARPMRPKQSKPMTKEEYLHAQRAHLYDNRAASDGNISDHSQHSAIARSNWSAPVQSSSRPAMYDNQGMEVEDNTSPNTTFDSAPPETHGYRSHGYPRGGYDNPAMRPVHEHSGSEHSSGDRNADQHSTDRSIDRSGDRSGDRSFDRGHPSRERSYDQRGDRNGQQRSFDRPGDRNGGRGGDGRHSGQRGGDRSFDRSSGGAQRSFDRGGEHSSPPSGSFDRGSVRSAQQSGGDRGSDRGGDRSVHRGSDRNSERDSRTSTPTRSTDTVV